jgi:hypothetical protein
MEELLNTTQPEKLTKDQRYYRRKKAKELLEEAKQKVEKLIKKK